MCLYPTSITEAQRNELSREKLISKLLLSIQAFTYSICAEAADIRHRANRGDQSFYTTYGIQSIAISNSLIIMPTAEGEESFHGRLGKLRHLGLSIMAASSALASEIIQLVLPLQSTAPSSTKVGSTQVPLRSPIVYPLLYGHVLTHVVAASKCCLLL